MKKILTFFVFHVFFINSLYLYSDDEHIIGVIPAGFFSNFLAVLNHVDWAIKHHKKPLVYWDEESYYHSKSGYRGFNNCWGYYFDSLLPPETELNILKDRAIKIYHAPDGSYIPWEYAYRKNFEKNYRLAMYKLIEKYIVIKPEILEKISDFYNKNMMHKKTIGVHIRGTDKHIEQARIPLDRYVAVLNNFQGYQYFIATDEESVIDYMKKNLNGTVIFFPSHRSTNGEPIHYPSEDIVGNAILGEEILIEAHLLSLCDLFVHSISNVATAVLFFNPNLEHVFLGPRKTKSKYLNIPGVADSYYSDLTLGSSK